MSYMVAPRHRKHIILPRGFAVVWFAVFLLLLAGDATAATARDRQQETCASLQVEIQQLLIQAVRQRNKSSQSPAAPEEHQRQKFYQDRLDDIEHRAKQAGCLPSGYNSSNEI